MRKKDDIKSVSAYAKATADRPWLAGVPMQNKVEHGVKPYGFYILFIICAFLSFPLAHAAKKGMYAQRPKTKKIAQIHSLRSLTPFLSKVVAYKSPSFSHVCYAYVNSKIEPFVPKHKKYCRFLRLKATASKPYLYEMHVSDNYLQKSPLLMRYISQHEATVIRRSIEKRKKKFEDM